MLLLCGYCRVPRQLHVLSPSLPTRRSSDLALPRRDRGPQHPAPAPRPGRPRGPGGLARLSADLDAVERRRGVAHAYVDLLADGRHVRPGRSEEHKPELQPLMRILYDVLCLKKKNTT